MEPEELHGVCSLVSWSSFRSEETQVGREELWVGSLASNLVWRWWSSSAFGTDARSESAPQALLCCSANSPWNSASEPLSSSLSSRSVHSITSFLSPLRGAHKTRSTTSSSTRIHGAENQSFSKVSFWWFSNDDIFNTFGFLMSTNCTGCLNKPLKKIVFSWFSVLRSAEICEQCWDFFKHYWDLLNCWEFRALLSAISMIQISVFCMLLSADINNLSSEKWQLWVIGGHLVVQTTTKSKKISH